MGRRENGRLRTFCLFLSLSGTGGHFASKSEQGDISGERRFEREGRSGRLTVWRELSLDLSLSPHTHTYTHTVESDILS